MKTSLQNTTDTGAPPQPMSSTKDVLMFDFDGVVVDSLDYFAGEFTSACVSRGYAQVGDETAFLRLFDVNLYAGMLQAGIPVEEINPILQVLERRMRDAPPRYGLFPGMHAALNTLAQAAPVYIVTSNLSAPVSSYLAGADVRGIRAVLGAEAERSKRVKIENVCRAWPDRAPYYVGDTLGDMLEAHAAGVSAVGVAWGWHGPERLAAGRPERIVRNPWELVQLFVSN